MAKEVPMSSGPRERRMYRKRVAGVDYEKSDPTPHDAYEPFDPKAEEVGMLSVGDAVLSALRQLNQERANERILRQLASLPDEDEHDFELDDSADDFGRGVRAGGLLVDRDGRPVSRIEDAWNPDADEPFIVPDVEAEREAAADAGGESAERERSESAPAAESGVSDEAS